MIWWGRASADGSTDHLDFGDHDPVAVGMAYVAVAVVDDHSGKTLVAKIVSFDLAYMLVALGDVGLFAAFDVEGNIADVGRPAGYGEMQRACHDPRDNLAVAEYSCMCNHSGLMAPG